MNALTIPLFHHDTRIPHCSTDHAILMLLASVNVLVLNGFVKARAKWNKKLLL